MFSYTPNRPPETKALNRTEKPITIDGLNRAQDRVYSALGVRQPGGHKVPTAASHESNAGQRSVTCPACGEQTMIFRLAQRAPLMYAHHLSNGRKCAESGKPYQ